MTVHYSDAFKRQLKRLSRKYRRIRSDVKPLIDDLESSKTPGDQIQGTGYTVYKVRLANTDAQRGKSGGYRVIYYIEQQSDILLVSIYSKSEQDDIENSEIIEIIQKEEG